jgi:hypothetical protein
MTEPKYDPRNRELAEKIYRDLVTHAVQATDGSVGPGTDPVKLAHVSFKLAAAFRRVEEELNAANLPKNQDFKINVDDIASWNK